MKNLVIDFESKSAADLKKCGAAAYAEHPSTDVLCLALKFEGEEPKVWVPPTVDLDDTQLPAGSFISARDVRHMIADATHVIAHNASFEFNIWKSVMVPRYGFPMIDPMQWRDTAAQAAMFGLPRTLEGACVVMGVPQQKDMEGHRLMLRLCKPRAAYKVEKLRDPDWEKKLYWYGSREEIARLCQYCMQDVRAEEALYLALPELPKSEQILWRLDLEINDRGVRVDAPACRAILDAVETHTAEMTREFRRMTGLESPRQREATLQLLNSMGAEMEGLTARDVAAGLESTEDVTIHRILEIRQTLSKSSTAKYMTMLKAKCHDDRIRGSLMYHGAGTGRWSGRLIQPQNFPRGAFAEVDQCIDLFQAGDLEGVKLFFGDPMVAASTCLRGMLIPAEGCDFVCADYSSIEGRVLAWLAGEGTALDVYRAGRDPYKVAASAIYHVNYDDVTKEQRQRGKVAELACIAGGSCVLTNHGLKPIEDVTRRDKVWDGVAWVKQDGAVYNGERDVIEYEGLIATTDHLVWVEGEREPIQFGVAAASGKHLLTTGIGGTAIRLGRDYFGSDALDGAPSDLLRLGQVHRLWQSVMGCARKLAGRTLQGLPGLFPTKTDPEMVGSSADSGSAEVSQSERSGVSELRRARNHLRLSVGSGSGKMDAVASWTAATGDANRQGGQQQGVRPGQSPLGNARRESGESSDYSHDDGSHASAMAVFKECCAADAQSGENSRGDIRGSEECCFTTTKELAVYCGKVRVYDLLNAGPRHRYTVEGKLVHNCGYQGALGAFSKMAQNYGVNLPEAEIQDIVSKWRESRPMTVEYWAMLEEACRKAVATPGKVYSARSVKFRSTGKFLALRLPSGRCLWYAQPHFAVKDMPWGEKKKVLAYMGVDSMTHKWTEQFLYGGLLTENVTQATARDLLVNGMFAVENAGYRVVFHVHDEMVSEVLKGFGSVEEFEKLMCTLPPWAEDLPIKAEGWRGSRYKK